MQNDSDPVCRNPEEFIEQIKIFNMNQLPDVLLEVGPIIVPEYTGSRELTGMRLRVEAPV